MDYDQQTIELFAAIRDRLPPQTAAALVGFADGDLGALFEYAWIYRALETRGLVQFNSAVPFGFELTDYGRAFVTWYRQPRDLPAQLDMFDELAQEQQP